MYVKENQYNYKDTNISVYVHECFLVFSKNPLYDSIMLLKQTT